MVVKKKQGRKAILKKREKKIDTIAYGKLDIMWFWQWLKLAVDMGGQSLEVGAKKVLVEQTTKKRKHLVGGGSRGRFQNEKGFQGGVSTEQIVSGSVWKKQKGTSYKIEFNGLNIINLNELKRLPKIMNMTKREIFQHFNKWFVKNKELFADYSVHYAETNRDMIESNDYITVQIPKSIDRRKIDNQIDLLMKDLKLRTPGGKKREITFIRGVQKDVMQKQWDVFKYKTIDKLENSRIAKKVGYQTGEMLKIKGGKTQTQGVRAVQKSYASAKCIILNVSKGIFPKSTIE